ncbi:RCC1/BLIP-II [Wolfiporia cocos MD-104 SS10]|uniref:RCC1/BLIP-II n=1 Tax=Wolfiporia cocos (strain MD-104) TaxID=742152 RepID=A0A2H3JHN9_WOLCO|nr:RCC1/BLIP-II [Wolfiporia cocos MD-104 SS10]
MPALTDLPVELFLDHLFPLLLVGDLLRFSATNHNFYNLASDEAEWRRRTQEDFNFSGSETARTSGWKFLYKCFAHSKVFVWGSPSHGRLGLAENAIPQIRVINGVPYPYPVELRIPGARIVGLVAGEWSLHALDSEGRIFVCGKLNGSDGFRARHSEGFSMSHKQAIRPMRLSIPTRFRSLSCGRLHLAALDASSEVWTFASWGRPYKLVSPFLDCSSSDTTPIQVESGWAFCSTLTASGDVLVWWPFGNRMRKAYRAKESELDTQGDATKAVPTEQNPYVIPCYTWEMRSVDPVLLPSIPSATLPELRDAGLSEKESVAVTKLVKIAGAEDAIIGLTNKGHVLVYNCLTGEDDYRRGSWQYLPEFSELAQLRNHQTFRDTSTENKFLRITHISAQFRTFCAYSMGEHSVVLMGESPEYTNPTILPELQNRNIISVVLGDYHYGVLTEQGQLLTWDGFSNGALGLGDPSTIPAGQPGEFATDLRVPTEVRFDHQDWEDRRRERFCFAAAAGGWHMGALVIDLEPSEDEEMEDEEETDEDEDEDEEMDEETDEDEDDEDEDEMDEDTDEDEDEDEEGEEEETDEDEEEGGARGSEYALGAAWR